MLRRRGTPAGGLALLCVVLAMPAQASTPAPDLPPEAVAPEPPPVTRTQPAPARSAPVSTPSSAPVVGSAPAVVAPVVRVASAKSKPKPKSAARKPVVQKQRVAVPERAQPHDRGRVPLATLVVVDELNRGLLAVGGLLLLVTTLSGGMVLWAGRRVLKEDMV